MYTLATLLAKCIMVSCDSLDKLKEFPNRQEWCYNDLEFVRRAAAEGDEGAVALKLKEGISKLRWNSLHRKQPVYTPMRSFNPRK